VTSDDIVAGADARIAAHRTADVSLTLRDPGGNRLPAGLVASVEQVRHEFLFGCNTYSWGRCGTPDGDRAYADRFSALFNYATLPFYWGPVPPYPQLEAYEGAEGSTREEATRDLARWCVRRGIAPKGHPLLFFREPAWLAGRSPDELERFLWARVTREVAAFGGLIDIWDVVNEPTNMLREAPEQGAYASSQAYHRLGEVGVIARAFALARAANPRATLVLNEVDMSSRFLDLVERCLDAGVPIDAIGIQSHELERYSGPQEVWALCERFGRFGLPLHVTELMLPSGDDGLRASFDWTRRADWVTTGAGERRQAAEVDELYRVLFSHPAIAAVTWWDLADHGACLATPTGLLRPDLTLKPAYHALTRLVRDQWWTRAEATVQSEGNVRFRGFFGHYRVRVADAQGSLDGLCEVHAGENRPVELRLSRADPVAG